ncbi:Uncharacterized protein TCM_027406 [Theobroma cacao]|uniref:Uncharacterized protein n=1 Tax=Theobroma cacao TaxID=3641 RepID=A0A061GG42_THECC|nr:Uncharacterized protein TCM_027406 [Theobroma cacao]
MITYGGHWVNDTYKSGETRVMGVGSDLTFSSLMKLVKDVVGVNSQNHEIELHALLSHAAVARECSGSIAIHKRHYDGLSANVQLLNFARTITRLGLRWRVMLFPFARLGILVSGKSP